MTSLESTGAPDAAVAAGQTLDRADPEVITIEELAGLLRVNHKTVREAIARGEIPGVRRIGVAVRIYRAAVIDWLAKGQGRASGSRRIR
jgi:excisionase family DNA binding protein